MAGQALNPGNLPTLYLSLKAHWCCKSCFANGEHPDFEVVKTYVSEGVDVMERSCKLQWRSALEIMFRTRTARAANILLQTVIKVEDEPLLTAVCWKSAAGEAVGSICSLNTSLCKRFFSDEFSFLVLRSSAYCIKWLQSLLELALLYLFVPPMRNESVWNFGRELPKQRGFAGNKLLNSSSMYCDAQITATLVQLLQDPSPDFLRNQKCIKSETNLGLKDPFGGVSLPSLILVKLLIGCARATLQVLNQ